MDNHVEHALIRGLLRRRPRSYPKWRWLRERGRMPEWEALPVGYLLREARAGAGLTQRELAERLGCSQQAVAQAERWESNPTVALIERWATATARHPRAASCQRAGYHAG